MNVDDMASTFRHTQTKHHHTTLLLSSFHFFFFHCCCSSSSSSCPRLFSSLLQMPTMISPATASSLKMCNLEYLPSSASSSSSSSSSGLQKLLHHDQSNPIPPHTSPIQPAESAWLTDHLQPPFHVLHKVPTGEGPYVKAKQAQLVDKNPDHAIALFWAAIKAGDRVDSALKDMAIVMKQQSRSEEAIEAITSLRDRCSEQAQESLDNVLLDLYKRCGKLDNQISLLKHKLNLIHKGVAFNGRRTKTARSQGKKFQVSLEQEATRLLGNLGWAYMQQFNYSAAEAVYRKALSIEQDNNKVCNLGICLMKQGRLEEARAVLQSVSPVIGDKKGNSESRIKSYERAQEMLEELQASLDSDQQRTSSIASSVCGSQEFELWSYWKPWQPPGFFRESSCEASGFQPEQLSDFPDGLGETCSERSNVDGWRALASSDVGRPGFHGARITEWSIAQLDHKELRCQEREGSMLTEARFQHKATVLQDRTGEAKLDLQGEEGLPLMTLARTNESNAMATSKVGPRPKHSVVVSRGEVDEASVLSQSLSKVLTNMTMGLDNGTTTHTGPAAGPPSITLVVPASFQHLQSLPLPNNNNNNSRKMEMMMRQRRLPVFQDLTVIGSATA